MAVCAGLILLSPFAAAGLALINTGLSRSRSAAHAMLASLTTFAVAALVYIVCGFSWEGFVGSPAHVYTLGGKTWNWLGSSPFFLRGMPLEISPASLALWLQIFSVGVAALIPLGAGGDRWRLRSICASTAIFAGWTYPLFAHWVWGGGWLAQLGTNYGIGHGFVDAAGSGALQATGGLTALAMVWILGPRRRKYSSSGMPTAIPGHNVILVILGCLLALAGWLGLNAAGAMLFAGSAASGIVLIAVNTIAAAAASSLTAVIITRVRFGRPDASLTANGWIGGLAASSAACSLIKPAEAILLGIVAGALVTFSVEWFEFGLRVDDPGGAISAHGLAGLWGVFAAGLFARFPVAAPYQWLAQLIGIATLIGCVLPMSYGLNWLLNRFYPQRVDLEGERQGMDLHELGADAYPEFMTHTEEYLPR